MEKAFTPRLRGNTFFLFLLRCAKDELGVAPSWGSSSNGLTQSRLFTSLMHTVDATYAPTNEKTLGSYMSQFLNGTRTDSPTYFPFRSSSFRAGAEIRLHTDYAGALAAMDSLCRTFLKTDNDVDVRLLTAGLVDLILADDTVPADTRFNTGFREAAKADLETETSFLLQPFLLSVWSYIVLSQPDAKEGAETYLAWTENAGSGNPRRICTNWGSDRAKKIAVFVTLPEIGEPTNTAETEEAETPPAPDTQEPDETGQAANEPDQAEPSGPSTQQTLTNYGTIYQQHAGTIINIDHVDTLNI